MILLFFTLFGSGLIIELNFFPSSISYLLSISPISMIVSAMQSYLYSGFIDWGLTILPFLMSIGILLINSALIRNKLRQ
jgi:ABC-type polysaccharide/polyol phosphate export permease